MEPSASTQVSYEEMRGSALDCAKCAYEQGLIWTFDSTEDTLSLYISTLLASFLDSDLFPRWFRKPGDCVSISSDGWAGMGTT